MCLANERKPKTCACGLDSAMKTICRQFMRTMCACAPVRMYVYLGSSQRSKINAIRKEFHRNNSIVCRCGFSFLTHIGIAS